MLDATIAVSIVVTRYGVHSTSDSVWCSLNHGSQYPGFEYTALLYLNEQGTEYTGGKFSFVDPAVDQKGQRSSALIPRP